MKNFILKYSAIKFSIGLSFVLGATFLGETFGEQQSVPVGSQTNDWIEMFNGRDLTGWVAEGVDQRQIDEIKDKPLKGFVSVQNHGKVIEFRNLRLKTSKSK